LFPRIPSLKGSSRSADFSGTDLLFDNIYFIITDILHTKSQGPYGKHTQTPKR
jgi:hypothetical protein